ncbi:DUF2520 domain-containing protein [Deminuibacter soli]|uniref:DUF2520 domain-containing protein n=2 Tax=Deminuibacter soli TaxID=2291815 RepID=A0A3E1NGK3_9BACT|nr:DUF2520 domain-containing protein [Deminuibacter soli]
MKVALIGSGNVATVLGRKIKAAHHTIAMVYSRQLEKAEVLAGELEATAVDTLEAVETAQADICIIAVADTALQVIAPTLRLSKGIAVHTSGASDMDILRGTAPGYGVLYPLQSIRRETAQVPVTPFLTEGSSPAVLDTITGFARTLSPLVDHASAADRLKLHLAAVFTSNFSNHLYTLAADYCKAQKLDFDLLLPLIQETAARLSHYPPSQTQTGPAIRNDQGTIAKHLALLHNNTDAAEVYRVLTESISRYYGLRLDC